ncbi:hypothetical protein GCM10022234_03810 [Aeromicrobium panaciterrae]
MILVGDGYSPFMTETPSEPDVPDPLEPPSRPTAPDLPDPAFPEVLPGGDDAPDQPASPDDPS